MEWRLRIECKSAVCPGSGLGHPGQVDRDVVFDSFGLPYIPGKRLKAMLSEAYDELRLYKRGTDAETRFGKIFGKTGDVEPGPFSIRSGEVDGADRIRAWLNHQKNPLTRQDVVDSFTEIRRQTAMDRKSGAPQENTLRTTRVLRMGLVFYAPVDGIDEWEEAVGDAARALQFIGTGRTRGWGHVRCKLEQLASPSKRIATRPRVEGNGCIGVRFHLEGPAVFPVLGGDPNTVLTDDCVPGSNIRGFLAARYIAKNNNKVDGRFYDLFFSDRIRFSSGHPRVGSRYVGGNGIRSTPIPHSLREFKSTEGAYCDLVDGLPNEPVRRVRGWWVQECEGSSEHGRALTRLHYHNARAADQRIGRAVGEQYTKFDGLTDSQSGSFFSYEALQSGQDFDAEIHGFRTDLCLLSELVADGEKIRIGRSRNSEYGAAVWYWQSPQETAPIPKSDTLCERIIVTLLSDLIGVNEHGHPAPEFPFADLSAALEVNLDIDRAQSYTQTSWHAGYMAHQRLPRQQVPSLSAGTIFVVPLVAPAKPAFKRAVERSYGLRVEEGFGQIAVSSMTGSVDLKLPDKETLPPTPPVLSDSPEWRLACQVFLSQVQGKAMKRALSLADKATAEQLAKVSNSLLSRILLFVERPNLADMAAELNSLRPLAKIQLSKLWVSEKIGAQVESLHLHDFLLRVCHDFLSVYSWLQNDEVYVKSRTNWKQAFPNGAPEPPGGFPLRIVRLYLRHYIRALLWKKRDLNKAALPKSDAKGQVNG